MAATGMTQDTQDTPVITEYATSELQGDGVQQVQQNENVCDVFMFNGQQQDSAGNNGLSSAKNRSPSDHANNNGLSPRPVVVPEFLIPQYSTGINGFQQWLQQPAPATRSSTCSSNPLQHPLQHLLQHPLQQRLQHPLQHRSVACDFKLQRSVTNNIVV